MAGTSTKTKLITIRLPIALHDAITARVNATPAPVAGTVVNLLWRGLDVSALREAIKGLEAAITAKNAKIAALEKGIAQGLGRSSGPLPKPMSADPTSEKPVAAILPITGTEFPKRVALKAKSKGKDKP